MQKKSAKRRMKRSLVKAGRPIIPGLAPGTLTVDPAAPKPVIKIFGFGPETDADKVDEKVVEDPEEIRGVMDKWPIVWVDVVGLGDLETIRRLGEIFNLHRLALEDVINVNQRPKAEEYDDHLFMVARSMLRDTALGSEQISIFFGKGFVLTFQERIGDSFEGVRERLRKGKGRLRVAADHLVYALLDSIVDYNFPLLESYGERLEKLELETLEKPDISTLTEIHDVKRDLLMLRKAVWPLRELVNSLVRDYEDHFPGETQLFLRDCYDHVVEVMDLIESYREIASGLVDLYLSNISNRMNDVMKVLTLIATIFIPLGFIAGLYGMNFDHSVSPWNMPELFLPFGYPMALGMMTTVAAGMVYYFWKKGWIGGKRK